MINKTTDLCDVLTDIDYGRVHEELSREFAALVEAVQEQGKSGQMTITIKVRPENQMAMLNVESSVKAPKKPLNGSIFYYGEAGSLHRDDPRQLELKNLEAPKMKVVGEPERGPDGEPF